MAYILAEIGTSHCTSLKKAKDLIMASRDAGADCVKFQWVYADEILHPDTGFVELPTGSIRLYDRFKELEVSPDFYNDVLNFSHECGVDFACSPFGLKSLEQLIKISPDAIKIASPELNHFPMLKKIAKIQYPVILSSGVSQLNDIQKALSIVTDSKILQETTTTTTGRIIPLRSLLHCITSYPAPEDEYNLLVLKTLHNIFKISVGISDHSLDPILVPVLSVFCGATIIEKHITLSRETRGLDDPVALNPEMFGKMVKTVREIDEKQTERDLPDCLLKNYSQEKIKTVLGNGKKELAPAEKGNYLRTNRSIHFISAMTKGSYINSSDIAILRTEKVLTPGISPEFLDQVIGEKLQRDVTAGKGLEWEDLKRIKS